MRPLPALALCVLGPGLAFAGGARADGAAALYADKCQKCHGEDGKGLTKMGKKLHADDFTDPRWQKEQTEESMIKAITHGSGRKTSPSTHVQTGASSDGLMLL